MKNDPMKFAALMEPDQRARAERWQTLMIYLEPFAKELTRIYTLMPTKFIVDCSTGEISQYIEPEWQKAIDKVMEARDDMIKTNFPEFYPKEELI